MSPATRSAPSDQSGKPIVERIDPTANVLLLVEAAVTRLNDLASALDLRQSRENKHLREMAKLRAKHDKEMRKLERDRLEKIRQVDVAATKTEADRALVAIQALAAKGAIDADNIRTALNATAATIAKQTSDTVGEITTRIAALEKANYEGQGRSKVSDPQIAELLLKVNALTSSRDTIGGERRGIGQSWQAVLGLVGLLAGLAALLARIGPHP